MENFQIIHIRTAVKYNINRCTQCLRLKSETFNQLMGELPPLRVLKNNPFYNTGVGYAGPINIRRSGGRGIKTQKGYIAIFVCMSTKAVHLEAVGDLTSQTFIAALRRFVARRGLVKTLFSDNGTNFVGVKRKLKTTMIAPIIQWQT